MSLPIDLEFNCPKCGAAIKKQGWQSINTQMPGVAEKIMSGELFSFTCPKCGLRDHVEYELLYNDLEHDMMVQVLHEPEKRHVDIKMLEKTTSMMAGCQIRVVKNFRQLAEKVTALEYGRDDRIIELIKASLLIVGEKTDANMKGTAYSARNSREYVNIFLDEGMVARTDVTDEYYKDNLERFSSIVDENPPATHVYDQTWAKDVLSRHLDLVPGLSNTDSNKPEQKNEDVKQADASILIPLVCSSCRHQIPPDSIFCPFCGARYNESQKKNQPISEIIYFDENNRIVDKEKAVRAIIREIDENGNLIREIFGEIGQGSYEYVTDEEFDSISSGERPVRTLSTKENNRDLRYALDEKKDYPKKYPKNNTFESNNINTHIDVQLDNRKDETENEYSGKRGGRKNKIALIVIIIAIVLAAFASPIIVCQVNHTLAVKAMEANNPELAVAYTNKDFLFSDSLCIEANYAAGKANYDQGQYERAQQFFERCGAQGEDYVTLCQIRLSLEKGELNEALFTLRKCNESIEKDKVADEVYTALGIIAVKDGDFRAAREYFSHCKEKPEGVMYHNIIDLVDKGSFQEAKLAIEQAETLYQEGIKKEDWRSLLRTIANSGLEYHKRLMIESVIRYLSPETTEKNAIAEIVLCISRNERMVKENGSYLGIRRGIGEAHFDKEAFCEIASKDLLYKECGSNNMGKILIIQQQKPVAGTREVPATAIAFEMMQSLPKDFFPESLDEVSYIIEISYDYDHEGSYDVYEGVFRSSFSSAVRFNGLITAKSYQGYEVYKNSLVYGESPPSSYTSKTESSLKYMSGGAPKLDDQIKDTLTFVFEQIHNEV